MAGTQSSSRTDHAEVAFPRLSLALVELHAPDAYAALRNAYQHAYGAADPALLELARLRIASLLDPAAAAVSPPSFGLSEPKLRALGDWSSAGVYTPAERACLAFVDQFVFYVPDVSDELIDDLLRHLSPADVYGFVSGVYVLDAMQRLSLSLAGLFNTEKDHEDG
jgi:alkylhydroperoxidase family enzyme